MIRGYFSLFTIWTLGLIEFVTNMNSVIFGTIPYKTLIRLNLNEKQSMRGILRRLLISLFKLRYFNITLVLRILL